MKVTHEMRIAGKCPVNEGHDTYDLIVSALHIVKVEDILAAVDALAQPAFQEDITVALSAALPRCQITTIGHHSGVKTTCIVG